MRCETCRKIMELDFLTGCYQEECETCEALRAITEKQQKQKQFTENEAINL